MVSVSFISFEKYELRMRKNLFDIFSSFSSKKPSMKLFLTSILGQNRASETLVQFTKPWTLCLVSVLRYRGSKMKNTRKLRFFKNFFSKNLILNQKDLAQLLVKTWYPYLFSILRNSPHKFEKLADLTKSA